MYVNYANPTIDPHKIYTFLRKKDDEVIVIAVNFSNENRHCDIHIPQHAFDILDLTKGSFMATELLTEKRQKKTISPEQPFSTDIQPNNAVIWKVKTSAKERTSDKTKKSSVEKGSVQ